MLKFVLSLIYILYENEADGDDSIYVMMTRFMMIIIIIMMLTISVMTAAVEL